MPEVRYLVRVVPLPARIGGADWDARWQEELRQSFSLIEQAVGGHAIGERQIRGLTLVQTSNGVRTLRRAFEGVDARGQPIRIYRSDAAGRGAYVLSAVITTGAQTPEEMPVRVRQAWARGVFAINLSGFPP